MDTSSVVFGIGATRDVGWHVRRLGASRVMVVTDAGLAGGRAVTSVLTSLKEAGVDIALFDDVAIEPTDTSFQRAIAFARDGRFDGYVAVGGGSVIDTAKAANLYATYPNDLLAYVNPPIGRGEDVPGPLAPLVAVPTTAGTGSETTGVAIFDVLSLHAKTGIAHRSLRPALGIVDPDNARGMPPMVAACSGLDVLCHAVESLTALPFNHRDAPPSPASRPAYQGANPVSDVWSSTAIRIVRDNLLRSIDDPDDDDARAQMMLAATYAGIGFGNAGVHLPHGMSYPVSGMVRTYRPAGYPESNAIVPHGMAVILTAPAVFRFTAPADPERHHRAAALLGVGDDVDPRDGEAVGEALAGALERIMLATGMPNGLASVGFDASDAPRLAAGTLPQHRVTKLSPRPADEADLVALFESALSYW
ncbi:MAG: iron-containing alcohol dehydrogenase [Trueperaceae bacterium]|nr:iron-containing alcohol dehydrogenase [Trueperaceae bacterium]